MAGPARAEERRATLIRVAREQADAAVAIDARGTVGAFAVADAIDGAEAAGIIGARNEATVIAFAGLVAACADGSRNTAVLAAGDDEQHD